MQLHHLEHSCPQKKSCCMNILNQFHDGQDNQYLTNKNLPIGQAPLHPALPPPTERQSFCQRWCSIYPFKGEEQEHGPYKEIGLNGYWIWHTLNKCFVFKYMETKQPSKLNSHNLNAKIALSLALWQSSPPTGSLNACFENRVHCGN